jgi:hypothetical protein
VIVTFTSALQPRASVSDGKGGHADRQRLHLHELLRCRQGSPRAGSASTNNLIQKQRKQVIEGAASMRLEPVVTFSGALAGTANNGTAGAHGSTPASSAAAERASLDILA